MNDWKKISEKEEVLLWSIQNEIHYNSEKIYFGSSILRYKHLLNFFKSEKKGLVLDLGCSPGHNTQILLKLGFEVVGIDLNELYLKKYNPKWLDLFNLTISNIERSDLPFKDETFDYIVFTEVLEHIAIKDPIIIFKEIRRILKPRGIIYLSTPNVANISNQISLLFNQNIFWSPEIFYGSLDRHNREYVSGEVKNLLRESGFNSIEIGYFNAHSNWNSKTPDFFKPLLFLLTESGLNGKINYLFNNTIFAIARK